MGPAAWKNQSRKSTGEESVPKKAENTEAWLQSLATAIDGEQAQNGTPRGTPVSLLNV